MDDSPYKPILDLVDWQLLVNDNDEFKIRDKMTDDSIIIEHDDKYEIFEIIQRLKDELWEESADK